MRKQLRDFLLGSQQAIAMFGATTLVGILTGIPIGMTLFCAGLGTLLFHLVTGGRVPIFLGSSFAFLAPFAMIAPLVDGKMNMERNALRSWRCSNRGRCLLSLCSTLQVVWQRQGNETLPADCMRVNDYTDWTNTRPSRSINGLRKLVACRNSSYHCGGLRCTR